MERMTAEEYRKMTARKTNSKYHNQKAEIDGILFDSKAEAHRYVQLRLLKNAGEIKGFARQVSFILCNGVRYRADFVVCGKDGVTWVEDVKGVETEGFKIKKKLWKQTYPWWELRVIK